MFCLFGWRLEIFGFSGGESGDIMMVAAAPPPQTEFILHKLQYKCLQRFFNRRYSSDAISANDHHFYSPAKKVKMHSKELKKPQ